MLFGDFHSVRRNLGGVGAGAFVEHIPSPGIVSGGFDYLIGLDFTLHISGIILVLINAYGRILGIDRIVPVVVNTLGETACVLVEHILAGLGVFEIRSVHKLFVR